jgi:hypothetical protein
MRQWLLGEDTVKCKVIVDYKSLQQVKNFKYHSCENPYERRKKDIRQK